MGLAPGHWLCPASGQGLTGHKSRYRTPRDTTSPTPTQHHHTPRPAQAVGGTWALLHALACEEGEAVSFLLHQLAEFGSRNRSSPRRAWTGG